MPQLRWATLADLDFLVNADLKDGEAGGMADDRDESEIAAHRGRIAAFVTDEDKRALIADAAGAVGTIMWRYRNALKEPKEGFFPFLELLPLLPPDGRFAEIFQLWVAPAMRRRGIATELKLAVEREARARGIEMIYTHTAEFNEHVVELNLKLGYREIRRGPLWDEVVRVSLVKDLPKS